MKFFRMLSMAVCLTAVARAQTGFSVDLLSAGEPGYDALPDGVAVVDYFVDLESTDIWTAGGTRVTTENSATLRYARDLAGEIVLVNPGLGHRYTTFLSTTRGRDDGARFLNGGAGVGGGYPNSPTPETDPGLFSALWGVSSPPQPDGLNHDGYVARIAIDLGDFADRRDFLQVSTTPPDPSFPIVARCEVSNGNLGWINATFDHPALDGLRAWYLFDPVPEPASLGLLTIALFASRRSLQKPLNQEITP